MMKRLMTVLALAVALALPASGFAQATGNQGTVQKPKMSAEGGKEKHPEIHAAMNHLRQAKEILQNKAANDFEGHKHQAVESIDQAMEHLRQALAADKK